MEKIVFLIKGKYYRLQPTELAGTIKLIEIKELGPGDVVFYIEDYT
jgi:hypothetical protein